MNTPTEGPGLRLSGHYERVRGVSAPRIAKSIQRLNEMANYLGLRATHTPSESRRRKYLHMKKWAIETIAVLHELALAAGTEVTEPGLILEDPTIPRLTDNTGAYRIDFDDEE